MVYLVNSTTGYMAGQGLSALVIALSVVAIVALAARAFAGNRLPAVLNDVLLIGAEVLLLVSFAQFVLERVRLAADIYFIPVNYPASEQTSLNVALIGVACYLVAIPPARRQGVHRLRTHNIRRSCWNRPPNNDHMPFRMGGTTIRPSGGERRSQ